MQIVANSKELIELKAAVEGITSLIVLLKSEPEGVGNISEAVGICRKCIELAKEKIDILEECTMESCASESWDKISSSAVSSGFVAGEAQLNTLSNDSEQEVFNPSNSKIEQNESSVRNPSSEASEEKRRFYELAANIRKHLPADHKSKGILIAQIYQRSKELYISEKDWSGFICSVYLTAE